MWRLLYIVLDKPPLCSAMLIGSIWNLLAFVGKNLLEPINKSCSITCIMFVIVIQQGNQLLKTNMYPLNLSVHVLDM